MFRSFEFSHAITRMPADSAVEGLRAVDTGAPDIAIFRAHHAAYLAALEGAGVEVITLPALPDYPDSVFVEDAALCLPNGAIGMRPGAPSRAGEVGEIMPALATHYGEVHRIDGPGHIDGGDVLVTEREVLVGQSARTDSAGIAALSRIVTPWGLTVREVETPPGVLHFKTDCALLDEETVISTRKLADSGCFAGYRILLTPEGEAAGANMIRVNDKVIMAAGFPRTAEMLDQAGYSICEVPNTEAAKLDAGMSCMSLRFSPPQT